MSATTTTSLPARGDCPDHPGLATYCTSTGFCTCGRAHREWPTMPALTRPSLAVDHVRALVDNLDAKLRAERALWVLVGAPAECVRPAGEAFGWRQGSGPCDCPPCLAR